MLSQDEPLHGDAKKMTSTDNNLQIRYEGNAVLWQGANRLEADVVEIDRDNDLLKAHGHVVSHCWTKHRTRNQERIPRNPQQAGCSRVYDCACAGADLYDDDERVAEYKAEWCWNGRTCK